MSVRVSSAEVQKARAFLYAQHKRGLRIPPKKFAAAARELGVGFRQLLKFIARLYAGGQLRSQFREESIEQLIRGGRK